MIGAQPVGQTYTTTVRKDREASMFDYQSLPFMTPDLCISRNSRVQSKPSVRLPTVSHVRKCRTFVVTNLYLASHSPFL